ncbi:MAG: prefoldin subunit [Candidatus Micrarchaeia archaeon]
MTQEEIERLTAEYAQLQDTLQSIMLQNDQFKAQQAEYKEALDILEKATGKIYRSVGGIVVEATKEEAIADIKEKQEFTEMRLNIIAKQLQETSKKEQSLREEISKLLKNQQDGKEE